jgi:hypothetical protein
VSIGAATGSSFRYLNGIGAVAILTLATSPAHNSFLSPSILVRGGLEGGISAHWAMILAAAASSYAVLSETRDPVYLLSQWLVLQFTTNTLLISRSEVFASFEPWLRRIMIRQRWLARLLLAKLRNAARKHSRPGSVRSTYQRSRPSRYVLHRCS